MSKFANPDVMMNMSLSDKIMHALFVTVLGMGITLIALLLIWFLISLMSKIIMSFEQRKLKKQAPIVEVSKPVVTPVVEEEDDEELIAVITAAIAASMNTSMHNIIVRNINRVDDDTPIWGKAGRRDVMNSRL